MGELPSTDPLSHPQPYSQQQYVQGADCSARDVLMHAGLPSVGSYPGGMDPAYMQPMPGQHGAWGMPLPMQAWSAAPPMQYVGAASPTGTRMPDAVQHAAPIHAGPSLASQQLSQHSAYGNSSSSTGGGRQNSGKAGPPRPPGSTSTTPIGGSSRGTVPTSPAPLYRSMSDNALRPVQLTAVGSSGSPCSAHLLYSHEAAGHAPSAHSAGMHAAVLHQHGVLAGPSGSHAPGLSVCAEASVASAEASSQSVNSQQVLQPPPHADMSMATGVVKGMAPRPASAHDAISQGTAQQPVNAPLPPPFAGMSMQARTSNPSGPAAGKVNVSAVKVPAGVQQSASSNPPMQGAPVSGLGPGPPTAWADSNNSQHADSPSMAPHAAGADPLTSMAASMDVHVTKMAGMQAQLAALHAHVGHLTSRLGESEATSARLREEKASLQAALANEQAARQAAAAAAVQGEGPLSDAAKKSLKALK